MWFYKSIFGILILCFSIPDSISFPKILFIYLFILLFYFILFIYLFYLVIM